MKGSYCIIIKISKPFYEKISNKTINFKKGYYVYIGSALNSIEKRIERHLKRKKKKHWHIDYLLEKRDVKIEKIFIKESKKKEECKIARKILKFGEPIKNFGSSDCNCISHLIKINKNKIKNLLKKEGFSVFQF
jgi:Uri superfamily endonuclease